MSAFTAASAQRGCRKADRAAFDAPAAAGTAVPPELVRHVAPLGWEHISPTGDRIRAQGAQPPWPAQAAARAALTAGSMSSHAPFARASMAAGRPFTLQYARERVAPELWSSPGLVRTNYAITAAWALAFLVKVAAELALLYAPSLSRRAGVVAIVLALVSAVRFTGWCPERVRGSRRA